MVERMFRVKLGSDRCWLGPEVGSNHLPLPADLVPTDDSVEAK